MLECFEGNVCEESRAIPQSCGKPGKPPSGGGRGRSGKDQARARSLGRKVLLIGRIRELALYRSEYLQAKGFSVVAPSSKPEVLEAIKRGGFDIVVLTYTLSNDSVLEFAELVRQQCPGCPVVVISNDGQADRKVAPDAVVIADHGPNALLAALHRLSDRRVQ